ncbi:hypothetical protein [Lacticaseibacillus parakribbianus]|uniref:hypothetical protein n=1 Tax=Lacticaseibacillus parakribbianus TaxID=2970927 RepID=UPI0021CB10C2|nr:hypothetical protein [Lacticaseibacillus parakribbianus]
MGDLLGGLLEFLLEPLAEYLFAPTYRPGHAVRNRVLFGLAGVVNAAGLGLGLWLALASLLGKRDWGLVALGGLFVVLFGGLLVRLVIRGLQGRAAARAQAPRPATGYHEEHLEP